MSGDISEAKKVLPFPVLLTRLGLAGHAKKRALCPLHDDQHASFSLYRDDRGQWRFKCFAGCGQGDEITFLEKLKGISNKEATKLFLEMAAVNGSTPAKLFVAARAVEQRKEAKPNDSPTATPQTLDWQECVESFTDKDALRLQLQRGYSRDLCLWLKQNGLIGIFEGCFAFPVHDSASNVVAVHYRLKDCSWRYFPQGAKVRPLVIGKLVAGDPVHVFESQWDAFAFMDKSGERYGIIITRGAPNGGHVAGLIPQSATCFCWTQNDEPGLRWEKSVVANTKCAVRRVKIPTPFKDLNQWTQSGATVDHLVAAMMNAEIATPVLDDANRDEPTEAAEPFPLDCLPSLI